MVIELGTPRSSIRTCVPLRSLCIRIYTVPYPGRSIDRRLQPRVPCEIRAIREE